MKYIRTKDGHIYAFYEVKDYSERIIIGFPSKELKERLVGGGGVWLEKADIIKQADTIEELCDEFIHGRMTFRTLKECLDYAPLGGEVFGAIWIRGGHNEPILKSIAEMSSKGELELL